MDKPDLTPARAMEQAGYTIGAYLSQAEEEIDNRYGDGYARANPELLGACVRAQVDDFTCVSISAVLHDIKSALSDVGVAIDALASATELGD